MGLELVKHLLVGKFRERSELPEVIEIEARKGARFDRRHGEA